MDLPVGGPQFPVHYTCLNIYLSMTLKVSFSSYSRSLIIIAESHANEKRHSEVEDNPTLNLPPLFVVIHLRAIHIHPNCRGIVVAQPTEDSIKWSIDVVALRDIPAAVDMLTLRNEFYLNWNINQTFN